MVESLSGDIARPPLVQPLVFVQQAPSEAFSKIQTTLNIQYTDSEYTKALNRIGLGK